VGDESHFAFRQKLLDEDGCVRRGVVMMKQPGLFSPTFGATSSHVFTQSPQNSEFTVWPVGTGASRYHNCIDGGTIQEYFGYHVFGCLIFGYNKCWRILHKLLCLYALYAYYYYY
jgi:hypothetical protein